MTTARSQAIDVLAKFLLVDRAFPPQLREYPVCSASVSGARLIERELASLLPGWKVPTFPRGLTGARSSEAQEAYRRWLAAYQAGLDAGVRGVTALVHAEHSQHPDRWMLGYDLGEQLRSGKGEADSKCSASAPDAKCVDLVLSPDTLFPP